MVNALGATAIKCLAGAAFVLALGAQTDADRERRLADLESKMRRLDPEFSPQTGATVDSRLSDLELRLDALLARTSAATPPAVETNPLQPLSVTGDAQKSEEHETRLPVAGYMEAHFNKDSGEPGRADFHRFVLLFGHSFSDRIKFWSELEVEHALVEGGEERGELALEQAYLDFLVKPALNFRGGMVLSPVGLINERHEPPAFNGVERPFVETVIIPTTWRE